MKGEVDSGVLAAELSSAARRSEELHRESRRLLVSAVRRGAAAGMSQRQIARTVGRSQPEVARLLRFQPGSPTGSLLAHKRTEVIGAAAAAGFRDVRVFGSVARGQDGPDSDIDLLVVPPAGVTLFDLARLERTLSEMLGVRVEVVPEAGLRASIRDVVLAEAVPL
jgi:predicted nucleotidyltransferase